MVDIATVGERIKYIRERRRVSRDELAARVRMDMQLLQKVEDENHWIPEKLVKTIAKELETDQAWLLGVPWQRQSEKSGPDKDR